MKTFYLLRHEDVHSSSGVGVVAEGIIFDNSQAAMTWLTDVRTITVFSKVSDIKKLHGHEGKTEVVIEGCKKQAQLFKKCQEMAKLKKDLNDRKSQNKTK